MNEPTAQNAESDEVTRFIGEFRDSTAGSVQSLAMDPVLRETATQPAAVAAMIEELRDGDVEPRARAAEVLGRVGAPAEDAIPILTEIIETEPDGALRNAAIMALARIEKAVEQAKTVVRFEDGLLTVKAHGAPVGNVLKRISQQARIAVELGPDVANEPVFGEATEVPLDEGLRVLLADFDVFTYHRGGRGLLTIWVYFRGEGSGLYPVPPETWASTQDMESQFYNAEPEARMAALETLLERNPAEAGRYVAEALDDLDDSIRARALDQALLEGVDLPPDRLADLATYDPSPSVRFLALKGLRGNGDEARVAETLLDDPSPVLRKYAERVLDRLSGPKAPEGPAQ